MQRTRKMGPKQKMAEIGLLMVGTTLVVVGLVLSQCWEHILWTNFEQGLALSPDSPSFRKWRVTPVPITMSVYFWNWTNPEAVEEEGYKPHFTEMGPYVFREIHEKVNVSWNDNGTITYRNVKYWYFDARLTNGSLSDNVTSINVIAASLSYLSQDWSRFVLYPLSMVLSTSGQQLVWTRNVSQLLFEGFDNSIQKLVSYMPGYADEKFGWFYNRNGTPSDPYNMDTGARDIGAIGLLRFWNYRNSTDPGGGDNPCTDIEGSTGEFWPPNRTKTQPLTMYTTDMCRQVSYYYEHESSYKGMHTLVYAGTRETVDNGTMVEHNRCYCGAKALCRPSGVFDISNCSRGAPIFLSYPHFYNADPSYGDAVVGMRPQEHRHKFYMELEPRTGTPVNVAARVQVNVQLQRNRVLSIFRRVPNLLIPVMWVENRVALTDELVSGVQLLLFLDAVRQPVSYGLCTAGLVVNLAVFVFHYCFVYPLTRHKKNLPKIQHTKTDPDAVEEIRLHWPPRTEMATEVVRYNVPNHNSQLEVTS